MIDVKLPLRTAYYQCLNGNLSVNSQNVPVSDDAKKLSDAGVYPYVILSSQTGVWKSTMASFDSEETIVLDIVNKAAMRVAKSSVDIVANQILGLVQPTIYNNGLPPQYGISINLVRLNLDSYITLAANAADTVIRRILTFRQYVRQTGNNNPGPIPAGFKSPIIGSDFTNSTDYINPALQGLTIQVFYNNTQRFLQPGTEWTPIAGGGIRILLPGFNSQSGTQVFYLILN